VAIMLLVALLLVGNLLLVKGEAQPWEDRLFVWCGHPEGDFLAVIDFNNWSPTYGEVLHRAFLPTTAPTINPINNEPHHIAITQNGKFVITGGLASVLSGKDEIFIWEIDENGFPQFWSSMDVPGGCTDDFQPYNENGTEWLVSMMCDSSGGSPGDIVWFNVETLEFRQWSSSPEPIPDFNPHGFAYLPNFGVGVADFVLPTSMFTDNVIFRDTVRYFNADGSYNTTLTLPSKNSGYMEFKFVDDEGRGVTCGTHLNTLFLLQPFDIPPIRPLLDIAGALNHGIQQFSAAVMHMAPDHRRLYMSSALRYLLLIDIPEDLSHATIIDHYDFCDPLNGWDCSVTGYPATHFVVVNPEETRIVVSNYFVRIGNVQLKGTSTVHSFLVNSDRTKLTYENSFRVETEYSGNITYPHGLAYHRYYPSSACSLQLALFVALAPLLYFIF